MRAHALSNTRKLNHHWQSGNGGEEWWNVGYIGNTRYHFAPFYKLPSFLGETLVSASAWYGHNSTTRGIDLRAFENVFVPWASQSDKNGQIYITPIYTCIPTLGPFTSSNFRLFFMEDNVNRYIDIDTANDEQINLLIPSYDFIIYKLTIPEDVEFSGDINGFQVPALSEFFLDVELPSEFAPSINTKKLPKNYYNGALYNYPSRYNPGWENISKYLYFDGTLRYTYGEEIPTTRTIYLKGDAKPTFYGITKINEISRQQYNNTPITIHSSESGRSETVPIWGPSSNRQSQVVAPAIQIEPFYAYTPWENSQGTTYSWDVLPDAKYGFSTFYSESQKLISVHEAGVPTFYDYHGGYNSGLSPHNIVGLIKYPSAESSEPISGNYIYYGYMTRLRRITTARVKING